MVDQKIAGNRGEPCSKRALPDVIGAQSAIDLDKDVLGKVLGIVGRAGKPIAQVVDATAVKTHDLLPGCGIATQATANQEPGLLIFHAVPPTSLYVESDRSVPRFTADAMQNATWVSRIHN